MSDDFLYASRPAVPDGLEEAVWRRLLALREGGARERRLAGALSWVERHRAAAIVAGLVLLAGCTAGVLRAGGFVFRESVEQPAPPGTDVVAVPQRVVAREEALAEIPFEVRLPTWVPQGYALSDRAMVTLPEEGSPISEAWQVWLYWERDGGSVILFLAFPSEHYRGDELSFGPESAEEIEIAGQPAAAVRGNWVGSTWYPNAGGNVLWVSGDTAYWLQSTWVPLEDLIRIAESVR
jgi:hypothetical protein